MMRCSVFFLGTSVVTAPSRLAGGLPEFDGEQPHRSVKVMVAANRKVCMS